MKRKNTDRCRELRENQTETEKKLWMLLRNRQLSGVKFRRQFAVGGYILDFYSPEHSLCVEIDGGQHFEDEGIKRDELRTKKLSKAGIRVLRFNNLEVLNNISGVCDVICGVVEETKQTPHLNPLPTGERR